MAWTIKFHAKAFAELQKLDRLMHKRILQFIENKLAINSNPKKLGLPLKGKLAGLYKYRLGNYRLVCSIEHKNAIIVVLYLGHRKDVYKKA